MTRKSDRLQAAFLEKCTSHVDTLRPTPPTHTPVSSSGSSLQSPPNALSASNSVELLDTTRLTDTYPSAFADTHGLLSRAPFVYKTGPAWPTATGGPEAYPFRRRLHPVCDHPIASTWDQILTDTRAYLDSSGKAFEGIVPVGFGNVGAPAPPPFCPLVVTICVAPRSLAFADARAVAEHVKSAILAPAGFGDIDVAIWELAVSFSGGAAGLCALDPVLEGPSISPLRHPFAATLGLSIAQFDDSRCEGTLGLYMSRGDDLVGITAAHVVRPPCTFPENAGLSERVSERRIQHVVALGDNAYRVAVYKVEKEIGTLRKLAAEEGGRIEYLQALLDGGDDDSSGEIAGAMRIAVGDIQIANATCERLNTLHDEVTKLMAIVDNRVIGRVLYADPLGVTSEQDGQGYTRDWAAIKIAPNAFSEDFRGNRMYIGDRSENTFRTRMFPHAADSAEYAYPEFGLLQLSGIVPAFELAKLPHRNASGARALAAVKNGGTTGTTFGWVSQLAALVRHHDGGLDFWSRELTIVSHVDEPGPFSGKGDSGSVIADRRGRIIGLLTGGGGGGPSNATEVTFATPFCHLLPRIQEALPGIRLYDAAI